MKQNKFCKINELGKISRKSRRLCWKMPKFDEYGSYESYDYEPVHEMDKWVLIEELRHFQTILKEFMKHPVTSEKEIRKRQMLRDLEEYQQRLNLGTNSNQLTHIRESRKKPKMRDRHRARFSGKESETRRFIICICSYALDFLRESALGDGPEKWHKFCSARYITTNFGICRFD